MVVGLSSLDYENVGPEGERKKREYYEEVRFNRDLGDGGGVDGDGKRHDDGDSGSYEEVEVATGNKYSYNSGNRDPNYENTRRLVLPLSSLSA